MRTSREPAFRWWHNTPANRHLLNYSTSNARDDVTPTLPRDASFRDFHPEIHADLNQLHIHQERLQNQAIQGSEVVFSVIAFMVW